MGRPALEIKNAENNGLSVRQAWRTTWCTIHCCPIFYILPHHRLYIVSNMCVSIHISHCVETVYVLPLLPNNTAVKHFYTNGSSAKCRLDIYRWGAGLAVTRRIRDIGQNVLQSSLLTGRSSSQSHWHIFLLYSIPRRCLYQKYSNYTMN